MGLPFRINSINLRCWTCQIFILWGVLISLAANTIAQNTKSKNVLLICVDDLRSAIGVYGDDYAITPNIDLLASESLVFNNAFVQQAVCNPSRASMLTGLRPSTTGIFDLTTHIREVMPDVTTLPELFRQNGFLSLGFGKVFHNNLDDKQSWSEDLFVAKKLPKWKTPESINMYTEYGNGPSTEFATGYDEQYRDVIVTNKAIDKIKELGDEPFFLAVGYVRPHLPFVAPAKYLEMYKSINIPIPPNSGYPLFSPKIAHTQWAELKRYSDIPGIESMTDSTKRMLIKAYYACVTYTDELIGKLISELKTQGLYEETMIVFWSDHGFKLGEFGSWAKHTNYDIDTRAPLMIKDVQLGQGYRNDIVESIDIYKSLSEYFSLTPTQKLEGENILNTPISSSSQYAVSFISRSSGIIGTSIRTDRFRYVHWSDGNNELYDFDRYGEKINVALTADYKRTTDSFRKFVLEKGYENGKEIVIQNPLELQLVKEQTGYLISIRVSSDDLDERLIKSVQIHDLSGKQSFSQEAGDAPLEVCEIPSDLLQGGLYFFTIKNMGGQLVTGKFFINDPF